MEIRVLLADDHRVVRDGLCAVLAEQEDIRVVAQAAHGREALELTRRLMPDVVLMDVAMPELNGIEAATRIKRIHKAIRVVALSSYADQHHVLAMFDAGAWGYVVKDSAIEEVVTAIRRVHGGKKYLSAEVADVLVDQYVDRRSRDKPAAAAAPGLGTREREIVQLLAEGRTSAEIGRRLHLATSTVETHRRNVMKKLDLHSVATLTKYAVREGLTEP